MRSVTTSKSVASRDYHNHAMRQSLHTVLVTSLRLSMFAQVFLLNIIIGCILKQGGPGLNSHSCQKRFREL